MRNNGWSAFMSTVFLGLALAGSSWGAESIDMEVSTPAIKKLKEALAVRAEEIARWKAFGYVGEDREGLLAVRTLEGVKLVEKKQIQDLVTAENNDRRALIREIVLANNLKEEDAPKVMSLAARARRAAAAPGHWVQQPKDGSWVLARDVKE